MRRCASIEDGEEMGSLLKMDFNHHRINTFLDYLKVTKSDGELQEMYDQFEFCYPERLIIFGDFHGHGGLFFDYGWQQKDQKEDPSVVLMEDHGDEFLHYEQTRRFKSFSNLLNSLEEIPEEGIRVLISTELDFEAVIQLFQQKWETTFELVEKSWNWPKYFSNFYNGISPLYMDDTTVAEYAKMNNVSQKEIRDWVECEGRRRLIKSTFTPNQFLSGTYQFQDNSEYTIVIAISRPWFPVQHAIKSFIEELDQDPDLKVQNKTLVYGL